MARAKSPGSKDSSAHLGFEAKLWLAADKLRNNMDAAEYSRAERDRLPTAARRASAEARVNHVVLGLIFLKYISDTFEEHRAKLAAGQGDYAGANPEDQDEPSGARQSAEGSPKGERGGANQYKAENVFWVPPAARCSTLQNSAKQPTIGTVVDDAMVAIERDNPRLKGVLPKEYARPGLDTALRGSAFSKGEASPQSLSEAKDKHRLGELIDLIGTIVLIRSASGEEIAKADLPPDAQSGNESGATEGKVETRSLPSHRSVDLLGRVYEPSGTRQIRRRPTRRASVGSASQYFLTRFASAEGKNGGQPSGARKTAKGSPKGERGGAHQFYTPSCVVRLLVEMLAPYKGRIYDPCCGSGGSLPARRLRRDRSAHSGRAIAHGGVQSEKFVAAHGDRLGDISIYGQDKSARRKRRFGLLQRARRASTRRRARQSNATTRRLAVMNLALRGIEADFGPEHADTFRRDLHPDLRADYVLANPPFNDSDWFRKDDDVRWQFGVPPRGNANFAWVQHFIHYLAPAAPGTSGEWPASSSPMAVNSPSSLVKSRSPATRQPYPNSLRPSLGG